MDIHRLKVFMAVFNKKSFSRASEDLYLTQPTVSEHIRSLEEELNCKLFDRLGRTIIPTKEAELLYLYAAEIIEKADSLKDLMNQFKGNISGELIIGASTIPGTYVLPRLMAEFKNNYPAIKYQVIISDSKEITEKILNHELLLGFVGANINNARLHYQSFMEDNLIIVSSPSLIKKDVITIQELLAHPMILREDGSGTRIAFLKILQESGFGLNDLNIIGVFGSTDSVKQAVKTGLGISVLSRLAVIDELRHNMLKEIRLKDIQMNRQFHIVVHGVRTLPSAYKLFLETLRARSFKT